MTMAFVHDHPAITPQCCPLCGASGATVVFKHQNRLFDTVFEGELQRCRCGLLRTEPQLQPDALRKYYDCDAYYTHTTHGVLRQRARLLSDVLNMRNPIRTVRLTAEERLGFRRHLIRFAPRDFQLHTGK